MVESSGKINNANIKILFDYGAINSFISWYTLEKCGLVAYDHNDFKQVKINSKVKREIGPSVEKCLWT
jgi:hypothetical protein